MRRKDREIKDIEKMVEIIDKCDVCRIALPDGEYPYIVPFNFGYTYENGVIELYFHSAKEGRKIELIKNNKKCAFEMDCDHKFMTNTEKKYATMYYKSVIGKGELEFVEEDDEIIKGLDLIMSHYPAPEGFEYARASVKMVSIIKMRVTEITGKANVPK